MEKWMEMNGKCCTCGRIHSFASQVYSGKGILKDIPKYISQYCPQRAFVLSDLNTYRAAGEQVCRILEESGIRCVSFSLCHASIEPDEYSVGSAMMHFAPNCDIVVAVGSGVVNDIGKIVSHIAQKPYMIVATAPSMDGYASATSSMNRNGLKISLNSKCADIIVGDTEILCQAPMHMMKAGLGDMIAKYVSICEWRIAHLLIGEYYCEEIADLIRSALKKCMENADGLLQRSEVAVQSVFEGLVVGGIAMNYAGLSRPASGGEHYISHVMDMRSVEWGTPTDLHGIQCAIGTLVHVRLYEKLKTIRPDREKALASVRDFSLEEWNCRLRTLLGKGGEIMIAQEQKEKKYDKMRHAQRLEIILEKWDQILRILEEELPPSDWLEGILDSLEIPKRLSQIGIEDTWLPEFFRATKDIRDKYVLSRLAWDLGILEDLCREL